MVDDFADDDRGGITSAETQEEKEEVEILNDRRNISFLYAETGRWDDAITSIQTALRLSPGHLQTRYLLGKMLLMKGEAHAALEAMEKEPFEGARLVGLAMAHNPVGDREAAGNLCSEIFIRTHAGCHSLSQSANRRSNWMGSSSRYFFPNRDQGRKEFFTGVNGCY